MKSLRIAMICDMVPGQPGGSYISAQRLAELLIKRGHHVIIIAARDKNVPPVSNYNGVPMYQFYSLPLPGSKRYYQYSFPTKRALHDIFINERIELVHIMFPTYSGHVASRVAKYLGIPFMTHFHTQPENVSIFLPKFMRWKWIDWIITWFLVRFAARGKVTISPSELGKETIHSINPELPVTVISNGVDMSKFKPVDFQSFVDGRKLNTGDIHLLNVGRLTIEKNSVIIIEALPAILKEVPNLQLHIVGLGPRREFLEKLATDLGVRDHVHFLGKITDIEMKQVYSLCTAFILPSLAELEGMVVLEAMAFGKPILIANAPSSASRFFVRDNGFLFEPHDPADLAAKAIKLFKDTGLQKKFGDTSYALAQQYDIEKSVIKLEEVYRSILPDPTK